MSFGASSGKSSSESQEASSSTQASHQEDYSIVNTGITDQAAQQIKSYLTNYFNQASQQALNQTVIGQNLSAAQQALANASLQPSATAQYGAIDQLSDLLGLPRASAGSQAAANYASEKAQIDAFNAQNMNKASSFAGQNLNETALQQDLQKKITAWQALQPVYGQSTTGQGGKGGQSAGSAGGKGGSTKTNPGPTNVNGPLGGSIPVAQPTPAQNGTTQVSNGKGGTTTQPTYNGPVVGYQLPQGFDQSTLGYFGTDGGIYQNSMTPQQIVSGPTGPGNGGTGVNGKGGTATDGSGKLITVQPGQTGNILNGNNNIPSYGNYVTDPGITATADAKVKGVSSSASINSNPLGHSQLPDNATVYPNQKTFTGLSPSVVNSMQDQLAQLQTDIQNGNYKNIDAVLLDKLFGKGYDQHFWDQGQITPDLLANKFTQTKDAQGNTIYVAKSSDALGQNPYQGALAVLTPYTDPNNPLGSQNYSISYQLPGQDPSQSLTNPTDTQTAALAQITNSPGYQFALNQGLQAMNQKAAAAGNLRSGANAQDLLQYGQQYATSAYQQRIGQLTSMLGITNPALMQIAGQGTQQAANTSTSQGQLANLLPTILGTKAGAMSTIDQAANQVFQRYLTGVGDSAGASASAGMSKSSSSQSGFSVGL